MVCDPRSLDIPFADFIESESPTGELLDAIEFRIPTWWKQQLHYYAYSEALLWYAVLHLSPPCATGDPLLSRKTERERIQLFPWFNISASRTTPPFNV